jgi:tetratricopeptide (TPR) repeat protein
MRRFSSNLVTIVASLAACTVHAQMGGPMSGRPSGPQPAPELQSTSSSDKPELAARKAYNAGVKSVNKAKDFEAAAAKATSPDKKANALEKANDALNKALDQFTEALTNQSDMVEAWNYACYVHRRLGAYAESLDDCNHALQLKPDNFAAIENRGEAYLGLNRLADAKAAYMDLFNHARNLADQLMAAMRQWLGDHRQNAGGVSNADLDAFDHWVQERDGIAKQTASLGVDASDRGGTLLR